MTLYYWLVLIPGIFIFYVAAVSRIRWGKNRNIIVAEEASSNKKSLKLLNYREIIVSNSNYLSFLQSLDDKPVKKIRIWLAASAVLIIVRLFGGISVELKGMALLMMLLMVIVIVVPGILLQSAIKSRVKFILYALPYFVDLIAVCIQAGLTVESAIKFISERSDELDANLAGIMRHLIKRAGVSGLEEALLELYRSMDMTEMRMFCSTLQQSVHYGTSLYENLMELSKDIRELQLLESEEKIGNLSAKMSVPLILFVMFPITVLIAAPGILRMMKNALF